MIPEPEISIILPCLNEEKSIGLCIDKIKKVVEENNLNAETIIVNNGSTDNSCKIIREKGPSLKNAKLVHEHERGYGSAYLKGFEIEKGKYILMVDSDNSYDFNEIPKFINELKKGYDFVIGDRFKGNMEKNSMPTMHKHLGNPILSFILRTFFRTKIHDAHCGMRAITKQGLEKLNLRTTGMEFASEMIVKAIKNHLRVKELPINYYKRQGNSKLKSFADGWRHLRFMLLYSPLFLFFIPGIILFLLGITSIFWLYFGSPEILGIKLQFHPMFLSSLLIISGYQLMIFAVFAKTYAITHLKEKPVLNKIYKYLTIEKASILGIFIILFGAAIYIIIFFKWINTGFGELNQIKNSILALTLITIGIQTIFSSFMLSILGIKEK